MGLFELAENPSTPPQTTRTTKANAKFWRAAQEADHPEDSAFLLPGLQQVGIRYAEGDQSAPTTNLPPPGDQTMNASPAAKSKPARPSNRRRDSVCPSLIRIEATGTAPENLDHVESCQVYSGPQTARHAPDLNSTRLHVTRAKQGDQASWHELNLKLQHHLNERLRDARLPPNFELEDLIQDVLIHIYINLGEFRAAPASSLRAWARVIANHRLIDLWRRERAGRRDIGRRSDLAAAGEHADGRTQSPSSVLSQREQISGYAEVIAGLRPRYRAVLQMRENLNWSFQRIAHAFGYAKPGTVRSLLSRARNARREAMCERFSD